MSMGRLLRCPDETINVYMFIVLHIRLERNRGGICEGIPVMALLADGKLQDELKVSEKLCTGLSV